MAGSSPTRGTEEEVQYNERISGYVSIMLSSLINFASIADIRNFSFRGEKYVAMYGSVTFVACNIIILFDRVSILQKKFDLKKIKDGKLEGYTLLAFVLWWLAGVCSMTRSDGIAYDVLNIYFSSWYTLAVCFMTLNEWSASKDIISIHELTRLSATLPCWYILLVSSLVEMCSAAESFSSTKRIVLDHAVFSVIVGPVSATLATISILFHYKMISWFDIRPGGVIELLVAIFLGIWWICAVALLTSDGSAASSIQGTDSIPGTNLYLSLWISVFASISISMRWKAAKAIKKMSDVTTRARSKTPIGSTDI